MPYDHHTQLLRRVKYLERAIALDRHDYLQKKKSYDAIIDKLITMVQTGEITTYLGIDSIYYHLLERVGLGDEDLDKYAAEIRDFIS